MAPSRGRRKPLSSTSCSSRKWKRGRGRSRCELYFLHSSPLLLLFFNLLLATSVALAHAALADEATRAPSSSTADASDEDEPPHERRLRMLKELRRDFLRSEKAFRDTPQPQDKDQGGDRNVVCVEGPHKWASPVVLESIYLNLVRPLNADVVVVAPHPEYDPVSRDVRHLNAGNLRKGAERKLVSAKTLAEYYRRGGPPEGFSTSAANTTTTTPNDEHPLDDQAKAETRAREQRTLEVLVEVPANQTETDIAYQADSVLMQHDDCIYRRIFGSHLKAALTERDEPRSVLVSDMTLEFFRDSGWLSAHLMHLMTNKWKCLFAMRKAKMKLML